MTNGNGDSRWRDLPIWVKFVLVTVVGIYVAFQSWLGLSAIEDAKVNERVAENREQRIETDVHHQRQLDELTDGLEQLREQLTEHRLEDVHN